MLQIIMHQGQQKFKKKIQCSDYLNSYKLSLKSMSLKYNVTMLSIMARYYNLEANF